MQRPSRLASFAAVCAPRTPALRVTMVLALALAPVLLTGCGGGGSQVSRKTPTRAVKTHVHLLQTQSLHALAQSGVANSTLSAMSSGAGNSMGEGAVATSAGAASGGLSSTSAGANAAPVVPLTGQFISNIAATNHATRAAAIRRMQARHAAGRSRLVLAHARTRDEGPVPGSTPGSDPVPDPAPLPTFYYDDYLGLWVDTHDTPTASTYTLYVDEAKTQPAGSLTSTFPVDNVYPQVYTSSYNYTAGTLAGAHGTYTNTYNQDNSGSTTYQDVNADGSSDQGSSSQTAAYDYTWQNRTTNADKSYTTNVGTFHADGSGNTRTTSSDGYVYDVTYRADGSGHGRITGPDPGLPATIDWDAQGNTTIVYADGSSEYSQGWGYGGGYAESQTTTTTNVTSNTVSTSDSTMPPAPPSGAASGAASVKLTRKTGR